VSIGVTLAHAVETSDAMIARADAAMYQAKQGGRNRIAALTASG
jgi:PleD family two-component response regulator